MSNCLTQHAPSNDVASDETQYRKPYSEALPCKLRWPETRKALVLWTQEHLDRELSRMPTRSAWFERALSAHLNHEAVKR